MRLPVFDYSVSLGMLFTWAGGSLTLAVLFGAIRTRIDMLLNLHATQIQTIKDESAAQRQLMKEELAAHRADLDQHRVEDREQFAMMGERLFELTSSVQRLVGQSEVRMRADRRTN